MRTEHLDFFVKADFKRKCLASSIFSGGVACLFSSLVVSGFGQGDTPVETIEEPVIPRAFPVERYLDVWLKSPFQLEAAGEVTVAKQSFARDYVLTGLIQDGESSIAYIQNKKTGELKRLATGETVDGLVLVSATPSPDPQAASIVVSQGAENATLGYDEASFSQSAVPPVGYSPQDAANNGNPVNAISPMKQPSIQNQPGVLSGQLMNPSQGSANANGETGVVAGPNDAAVNPAAVRLQQLRERQHQAGGPDAKAGPASGSRRRLLLPSASQ